MIEAKEKVKKRTRLCMLPRVEEIIDEDWREDVKKCGFVYPIFINEQC